MRQSMRDRGHVRKLGELEAVVMQLMWARSEPTSVRDIVDELDRERELAYTTVMTVMDNLNRKQLLTRRMVGRAYSYQVAVTQAQYSAALIAAVVEDADDRTTALVQFLGQLEPAELARIRAALDASGASPSDGTDDPSARRWSLGRRR